MSTYEFHWLLLDIFLLRFLKQMFCLNIVIKELYSKIFIQIKNIFCNLFLLVKMHTSNIIIMTNQIAFYKLYCLFCFIWVNYAFYSVNLTD